MRYQFYTADVFTDHVFGGNQLAVFPKAGGLDTGQMQKVAREFNLSETVFVFPPETPQGTRRLRIFTPGVELPFAGHPTVGTAFVLSAIGEIPLQGEMIEIVFEEGVGPVPVKIFAERGRPVYTELTAAKLPEFGPEPPAIADLAAMLSLEAADLLAGAMKPQAVSCGIPFLFIPLRNREVLGRAKLNRDLWERFLSRYWAPSVYLLTDDPELQGSDWRSRMFAPAMGIEEDPATGAAATALAGYLGICDQFSDGTLKWVVEQGFEMGRPSLIKVEADKKQDKITEIRVGGASVLVSEGTMEIPTISN
jgi:trans-2,3-dihydro-3-hydroxyanthranilate isomerase